MQQELIEKICIAWDMGDCIHVQPIETGVLNENYIFTTSRGKYFIKSVRGKKQSVIPEIYAVEKYMHIHGVPSVVMHENKHGDISITEHGQMITVYSHIENKHRDAYSKEDCFKIGVTLGRIHIIGEEQEMQTLVKNSLTIPDAKNIIPELKKYQSVITTKGQNIDEMDKLFLQYIDLKLHGLEKYNLPEQLFPYTLIHGDYHPRNILFGDNGIILGVCDWEKTKYGPKAYEMIRAILYGPLQERPHESLIIEDIYKEQIQAYLKGYLSEYPMSPEEVLYGYDLFAYSYYLGTWIEVMYYDNNNSRANHLVMNQINQMQIVRETNLRDLIREVVLNYKK